MTRSLLPFQSEIDRPLSDNCTVLVDVETMMNPTFSQWLLFTLMLRIEDGKDKSVTLKMVSTEELRELSSSSRRD